MGHAIELNALNRGGVTESFPIDQYIQADFDLTVSKFRDGNIILEALRDFPGALDFSSFLPVRCLLP